MLNHSAMCRSIKYDYMNILTWTILKKTQILNGCETFAFKYKSCFIVFHPHINHVLKQTYIILNICRIILYVYCISVFSLYTTFIALGCLVILSGPPGEKNLVVLFANKGAEHSAL